MCCFFTALVLFGPRLAVLIWWLVDSTWINRAVDDRWFLAILGLIFLPWTFLMYLIVWPDGVVGFDWLWLGLGLLADIGSYAGGGYGNRDRFGYQ